MPEKNYKAIAAAKIVRPGDSPARLPRILVYGRNKKGKTYFCASAGIEQTLILDPESGTAQMKKKNPHTWPIDRWEDLDEAYQYLRGGDHPYKWVAVDGLTRMNGMALNFVMRQKAERAIDTQPDLVRRQDYGRSGQIMRDMMVSFDGLKKMGVIFTSQERPMEIESSEEDEDATDVTSAWVADLPNSPRSMVYSLVDVIGRIYVLNVTDAEGKTKAERRLWLAVSDQYDTGYRSDFVLPSYIKHPTVPKLIRAMDTGKTTAIKAG